MEIRKLEICIRMLSPRANQMIESYCNLPFPDIAGVRVPYFNNAKAGRRAELRALIGKGSPEEIVEEAQILSLQYNAGIFDKTGHCCRHNQHTGETVTADDIRHFLVDHNLGIECSGFVTHVLDAHYLETRGFKVSPKLHSASRANVLRYLITRLRPVENISVRTYADNRNSALVLGSIQPFKYENIQSGDLVIMLATGPGKKRNHILLVTKVDERGLSYVHARAWSREGLYGHGVSRGEIIFSQPQESLLAQTWTEQGYSGRDNETYAEAQNASTVEIRRLIL